MAFFEKKNLCCLDEKRLTKSIEKIIIFSIEKVNICDRMTKVFFAQIFGKENFYMPLIRIDRILILSVGYFERHGAWPWNIKCQAIYS